MSAVLDFQAARRRIESRAEHSIEVDARAIPVEMEFVPRATLIERFARNLTDAELAELIQVTLEECK